jgi:GT2 family glycosyltransferase
MAEAACTVSVIIVSWNTAELLVACLAALARRTRVPHEVLVVDNASKDDSCARVRREFPAVRLLSQDANQGFARASNVGLAAATGRYLLLLNPDTEVRDGAVDALVAFLDEHPRVGIAAPPLWNVDGSPQSSVQSFPTLRSEFMRQTMLVKVLPNRFEREARRRDTRRVEVVSGAALCIRRECYVAVGPLDEGIFMYYEDVDWCRRAHDAGWEIWSVDGPGVTHHKGASGTGDAFTRALLDSWRGTLHYFRKHGRPGAIRWLRAIALAGASMRALRAACLLALGRDRDGQRARLRAYARILRWAVGGSAP